MNELCFFNSINIKAPKQRVYKRLGYQEATTHLLPGQREEFEHYIDEALSLLELKGVARRVPVKERNEARVVLLEDILFESKLFVSLVTDCSEVIFMAATAGDRIIENIQSSQDDNLTKSVVYDAVASETVDASLEWIQEYFNQQLKRENKRLTQRRISAGYGDFSIQYQKTIYDILDLERLGIKITDYFILLPEKSVTAVSGIMEVRGEG